MAAPTAPIVGFQGKMYYNTGTYGSPTWTIIDNVGDLKMSDEADEGEIAIRGGGGYMLYVAGLRKVGWEWSSLYNPADAAITALVAAYDARTPKEFLILDQASGTAGSYGFRVMCMIMKAPRQEELSKAMMYDFAMKPTYSANAPARYTAS